jgi:hypothetical protein
MLFYLVIALLDQFDNLRLDLTNDREQGAGFGFVERLAASLGRSLEELPDAVHLQEIGNMADAVIVDFCEFIRGHDEPADIGLFLKETGLYLGGGCLGHGLIRIGCRQSVT